MHSIIYLRLFEKYYFIMFFRFKSGIQSTVQVYKMDYFLHIQLTSPDPSLDDYY